MIPMVGDRKQPHSWAWGNARKAASSSSMLTTTLGRMHIWRTPRALSPCMQAMAFSPSSIFLTPCEDKGWTVFTLDAEHEKIYEGDWSYGPYIKKHSTTMGSISWSTSMDAMGWSKVPDGAVLYGMGTYSTNQLHKISTARFYKVQNLEGDSVHLEENWGTLFEDGQSASCPEGHWVTGLYRTGSKHAPNTGSWQLTMATCTKFPNVEKWGECHDTEIFQKTGQDAAECPIVNDVPTAFVGFTHKGKEHNTALDGLHQAKCCEFPKKLIQLKHTNDLCVKTQSCVGVWPKQ